jgi:hypothetical protein
MVMRKLVALSVGLALLGCLIGGITHTFAAPISKSATISKFSGVDDDDIVCTSLGSTSFVTIPGMTRTFTLGGTASEEVVVMFNGSNMYAYNVDQFGETVTIQLVIDGVVQAPGGGIGIAGSFLLMLLVTARPM